jgi:hypothetical protein
MAPLTTQNRWTTQDGVDYLQLQSKAAGGVIIGGIDSNGIPYGSLTKFGVSSFNSITGAVTLSAGSNITLTPTGSNIQISSTGGGGSLTSPITSPSPLLFNVDTHFKGPNPWTDATNYGVRGVSAGVAPAIPGITATIAATGATAALSSASTFQNGDGVVIYGAGATNTMSTPGAPTVTPSVSASLTGSLLDVNGPVGATSYAYTIVARDVMGGLTAAAANGTTTTGASSLGMQTATVSTISLAGNTSGASIQGLVSVQTSAPHGMTAGAMFVMDGVVASNGVGANPFNGWFIVNTVADTTHFTYFINSVPANGAATAGTGGTATYWNCNRITWTAVAGAFQYYIYGRTAGSLALIGVSWPQNAALAGDITYLAFDDFGSPVTTFPNPPYYVPLTPPVAATNDMLVTTISSGAGTNSLVLANAAVNSVSNATILFDDAITFLAAANAANNDSSVLLPYGQYYVFNSPITLPSGSAVLQQGAVLLNETVNISGSSWRGAADEGALPSFAQAPHPAVIIGKANPGIYSTNNIYLHDLTIENQNNNGNNMVIEDLPSNIPAGVIDSVSFSLSGGATDYSTIALLIRGTHTNAGSVLAMSNILFSTSQNANLVATHPAFYADNFGIVNIDNLFMSGKGMLFRPTVSGMSVFASNVYSQANYEPFFSFTNAHGGGGAGVSLFVRNATFDTTSAPLAANLGGIGLNTNQGPVTGVPLTTTLDPSQNIRTSFASSPSVMDGLFFNNIVGGYGIVPQEVFDESVNVGPAFSAFVADMPPTAPTCATATAGPPFTSAGTWTFKFQWQYPNKGLGTLSGPSTGCTADGSTQQITVTLPSTPAAAGATGAVILASSGGGYGTIGNQTPSTTTQTFLFDTFTVGLGGVPTAGSGPSGIGPNGMSWGKTVVASHLNQPAAGAFANTCAMVSATSCTFSIALAYTGTPICVASVQDSTAVSGSCSVSGTTVTITAASSNSSTWGAVIIGNPN